MFIYLVPGARFHFFIFFHTINTINNKAISYTVGFRQSKTALFDWTFFRPDSSGPSSYRQSRVDFIVFVLFLEAVGVREYFCMAVENRLAVLCFARSSRATRASCATNLRPRGLVALGSTEAAKATFVALHSAESRQSYSRRSRCWQNGIDNARYCCRVIHAAGASRKTQSKKVESKKPFFDCVRKPHLGFSRKRW